MSIQKLLKETTLKSILNPATLVFIDAHSSVKDACLLLQTNKISSAPVYENQQLIGVLDYSDLVTFVLQYLHKIPKEQAFETDIAMPITEVINIPDIPIRQLLTLNPRKKWHTVSCNTSLEEATRTLLRENVERLYVLEEPSDSKMALDSCEFVGVYSHSCLIRFLANKFVVPSSADAWGSKSVKELDLVETEFPTISSQDSCLDAMQLLYAKNVHAVAITEKMPNGGLDLLGSISTSDIKELFGSRSHWRHIFDSSFEFFRFMRNEQGIRHGRDAIPSFTVTPETSLISVMKKMTAVKTHQIWVLSPDHVVSGVVSCAGISSVLLTL